jgi:hypothetical protein
VSGPTIWHFVKFFTEEKYADQFIKGSLHLKRLAHFMKLESNCEDGRPDENEAVATWWQPHDVAMKLSLPGFGDIEITKDDLAGPVSTSYVYHEHFHVFCLYAVHTTGFDTIAGKLHLAEDRAAELQRQLTIDERCLKFGPFAVFTPAVQFLSQLKEALQRRGQWSRGTLVEYYDEETYHGEFALKDIPFKKQKRFAYQKEFRICVDTNTLGDNPISIDIGDISHICVKIDSSQLNSQFKLNRLESSLTNSPHCDSTPNRP